MKEPNSNAAAAVLGAILAFPARPEARAAVERLGGEHFENPKHRVIFEAVCALVARGALPDLVTVCDELRARDHLDAAGGLLVVTSLLDAAPAIPALVGQYLDALDRVAARARAMRLARDLAAAARAGDAVAALRRVESQLAALTSNGRRALMMTPASSLVPQRVRYVWKDRIPLGMETLVVGSPGLGKTVFGLERCARITRGQLPGEFFGSPQTVLITSVEDHRRAVLLPRLIAAGADLERVFFISGPEGALLTLPDHLPLLANAVRETGAVFMFIDPLVAHLARDVNSWKDQDVRRVTAPLAELTEGYDVTVAGVIHLNRRETSDVLTRIGGSGGWGAAARSVLVVAEDPEDPTASLVAQAKLNVGPKLPALRFRLEGRLVDTPDGPTETVALAWSGESPHRADELLGRRETPAERSELQEACEILVQILAAGRMPAEQTFAEAGKAGVAKRTLERAKTRLRVRSRREGGRWFWELPGNPASKTANGPYIGGVGGVGGLGETRVSPGLSPPKVSKTAKGIAIETPLVHGVPPAVWDSLPPLARKAAELFDAEILDDVEAAR